ncbi:MAG: DUF3568 family protein [Candidatus Omnitrophota bacterium]|nr:MAG: DUF3568 family protein [Candidatus Omnitrophota bacterium]
MREKLVVWILLVCLPFTTCGCVALLAGAAGGAGTAVWLSGKLMQEVNAPFQKCLDASQSALKVLKHEITKVTVKDEVAQVIGTHMDGRTIWVDVHRIGRSSSRVEVRVGMMGDKEDARQILDKILLYL